MVLFRVTPAVNPAHRLAAPLLVRSAQHRLAQQANKRKSTCPAAAIQERWYLAPSSNSCRPGCASTTWWPMSDEANPNVDDDVAVVARGRGCCKQVGRRLEVEPQEDWRSIMGAPGGVICIGTGGGGGD